MFSFLMSSIFFFPQRRFLGNSSGGSWRRILLIFSPLYLGPSERFSVVRSHRTPSAAARAWCPLSSTVPAAATCGLWPLGAAKGQAPATRTSWHCFRRKEARPPLEEPEYLLWSFWKAQILWLDGSRSFQPPLHQLGREETQPVAKPTINERNGCWRFLTRSFCHQQSYPSIQLRYRYSRWGPLTNTSNRITPTIDWPFALSIKLEHVLDRMAVPWSKHHFFPSQTGKRTQWKAYSAKRSYGYASASHYNSFNRNSSWLVTEERKVSVDEKQSGIFSGLSLEGKRRKDHPDLDDDSFVTSNNPLVSHLAEEGIYELNGINTEGHLQDLVHAH